jgi:uncharacterized protein (TIGR02231 family)
VSIHVNKPGEIALGLSYVVMGASWHAAYDVRVTSDTAQTHLTYYGTITNQTKEDWAKVNLSLSTATPSEGGSPPELPTLRVTWRENVHSSASDRLDIMAEAMGVNMLQTQNVVFSRPSSSSSSSSLSGGGSRAPKSIAPPPAVKVLTTTTLDNISSTNFTIPRAATILSDGKPHKVTIAVLELQSKFTYTLVPKTTPHAYLKATTTNSSTLPFLKGTANVFMDSNFIANSDLKYVSPGESFALFLGTDSGVSLNYKPARKINETQGLLAKTHVMTHKQETIVKNMKNIEIAVVLYEQLPLSDDEKLKVRLVAPTLTGEKQEATDTSNIKLNTSNIIEWRQILASKQEFKFYFEYVVEWPKDRQISLE